MNQAATTVRNRRTVQSVSLQDNGKKRCVFDALTRRYGVNAVGDCRNERVACRSESSYSSAAAAAWTAASVVNSRPVVALNGYEWSVVTDLQCGRAGRGSRGGTPTGLYSTGLFAVIVIDTRRARDDYVLRILTPACI